MSRERFAEAEVRYAAMVERLRRTPSVSQSVKTGFGFGGLTIGGKLFATLRRDELLLKLPQARVALLIESGGGSPFDAGKGRPMKQWVTVKLEADENWGDLAQDAMQFVSS